MTTCSHRFMSSIFVDCGFARTAIKELSAIMVNGSTCPVLFSSTCPVLYSSTCPVLFSSTCPVLYSSTCPVLFSSMCPVLFSSTCPVLSVPHMQSSSTSVYPQPPNTEWTAVLQKNTSKPKLMNNLLFSRCYM